MIGPNFVTGIEDRAAIAGISINELCRQARIARSTFTRWKSGRTMPQLRVIERIDAVLSMATPPPAEAAE